MSSSNRMKKSHRISCRRQRRRRRPTTGNRPKSPGCGVRRGSENGGLTCSSKVSERLEALKSLIPSREGETVKTDQLFQQTADYIVRLRTQVAILQTLIEFYGSSESDSAVVS